MKAIYIYVYIHIYVGFRVWDIKRGLRVRGQELWYLNSAHLSTWARCRIEKSTGAGCKR